MDKVAFRAHLNSMEIARFGKCTKKKLVNGQITIWASENPGQSDEPL